MKYEVIAAKMSLQMFNGRFPSVEMNSMMDRLEFCAKLRITKEALTLIIVMIAKMASLSLSLSLFLTRKRNLLFTNKIASQNLDNGVFGNSFFLLSLSSSGG